jgi:hypothetical protein
VQTSQCVGLFGVVGAAVVIVIGFITRREPFAGVQMMLLGAALAANAMSFILVGDDAQPLRYVFMTVGLGFVAASTILSIRTRRRTAAMRLATRRE